MARQQPHRHRQRLIALCFLVLGACGSSIEPASPSGVTAPGEGTPLVFVPGIKGSALADEGGKTVFLTPLQALGLSTPRLALPTRFDGVVQERDGRHATGILRDLFIIPRLVGEHIYGPWLDALAKTKRPIYLFAYDWRRDNLETLEQLTHFVASVHQRHGSAVQLVGHSMGGLLSLALLARGTNDVASCAIVGSPLRGGIGFLPDLHVGVPVGRNQALLGADVIATFPSVYSFFPSTPGDGVDEPTLDFFDPAAWKRSKVGPYAVGHSPNPTFDAFLALALERAHQFRHLIELEPELTIPLTVVAGDGIPTLATARHSGDVWDFEQAPRQPGDGRVPLERARPRRLSHTLVTSKAEHAALLNDPTVIEALLAPH